MQSILPRRDGPGHPSIKIRVERKNNTNYTLRRICTFFYASIRTHKLLTRVGAIFPPHLKTYNSDHEKSHRPSLEGRQRKMTRKMTLAPVHRGEPGGWPGPAPFPR